MSGIDCSVNFLLNDCFETVFCVCVHVFPLYNESDCLILIFCIFVGQVLDILCRYNIKIDDIIAYYSNRKIYIFILYIMHTLKEQ